MDGDRARRRQKEPLWSGVHEAPAFSNEDVTATPWQAEPEFDTAPPPAPPRPGDEDEFVTAPGGPKQRRRAGQDRLTTVLVIVAAFAATFAAVALIATAGDDDDARSASGDPTEQLSPGAAARREVREVVIAYGHAASPEEGCHLFSRKAVTERFGSREQCDASAGLWSYDAVRVTDVDVDGDTAVALGESARGDRFRYELVKEDGAWRLSSLAEPERDVRNAVEDWSAATGSEICDTLTTRYTEELYGGRSECVLSASAVSSPARVISIQLEPRRLSRPTQSAEVRAELDGRTVKIELLFVGPGRRPQIDGVVDAVTGQAIQRR